MKFWTTPLPRTPRRLQRVEADLRHMHERPDQPLDLTAVRREMLRLIEAMAPAHADAEIQSVIDGYIDSFISDWRRGMYARHCADLNELDLLEIKICPYRDHSDELNNDVHSRLDHMDGAVSHVLDRIVDPDVPFTNPLSRGRREA